MYLYCKGKLQYYVDTSERGAERSGLSPVAPETKLEIALLLERCITRYTLQIKVQNGLPILLSPAVVN